MIFTLIFCGYGLGSFGRTSLATGLALALALYAGQVALSTWWFTRFQYGPAEWVWRALTCGSLPRGWAAA